MKQKEIVVLLFIAAGFLAGASVAHLFFMPTNWSEAKSIIYFSGFIGALIGLLIVKKMGK